MKLLIYPVQLLDFFPFFGGGGGLGFSLSLSLLLTSYENLENSLYLYCISCWPQKERFGLDDLYTSNIVPTYELLLTLLIGLTNSF